jgi:hypothetical protein
MPSQDLSAYMQASAFKQQPLPSQIFPASNKIFNNAFGQQQLIPRANVQVQNLLPQTIPIQQPVFIQKDFSQFPSTFSDGFNIPQTNLPVQSKLLAKNTFG